MSLALNIIVAISHLIIFDVRFVAYFLLCLLQSESDHFGFSWTLLLIGVVGGCVR